MLTNEKTAIDFGQFNELLNSNTDGASSYMFRRALIEFQFKWSLAEGNKERWKGLNIGHLTGKKERSYGEKKYFVENVAYNDPNNVSLLRRILAYLSHFPDTETEVDDNAKLTYEMFLTKSLYDLTEGVLVDPSGNNKISDDDYLRLARVLIALSNMSNAETKSAPFVILGINDKNFHINATESVLGQLLKEIWEAGPEKSISGEKYNCGDFGVRITEAGCTFLYDWQASFSFFAALHCFTFPPLFFLKDVSSIKFIINEVYNSSNALCWKHEVEAGRFCGSKNTIKSGTYLPVHNNKYVTFRQRVKDLHINHLLLYKTYLEKNYQLLTISEKDVSELTNMETGFISRYINKYSGWKTNEGAEECF